MRAWLVGWTVSLALALTGSGCGGGGGGGGTAAAASTAATPPVSVADAAEEAGAQALVAEDVAELARELNLDAATEARVRDLTWRSWQRLAADVRARGEALVEDDEETLTALMLERQTALDHEVAALLDPAQRAAFAELAGRLDDAPVATAGGAR